MKTSNLMLQVLLALVPGTLALTYLFGVGIIINVAAAMLFSLLLELTVLKIRQAPVSTIRDGSAVLTGALLGLALPPGLPLWMTFIGCLFAIIFAKHLYGGLGQNLFNPAMVGYAVLIISFPLAMSDWNFPTNIMTFDGTLIDGITAATPLDEFKFRGALTVDEYWLQFGEENWFAWVLINTGFLLGGLYLLATRVCTWMAPVSMLITLMVLSILFYDSGGSSSFGSPLFQLFSGATMMGAFFIVTDPVTSPDSFRGQFIFGAGVGLLTFIIRNYGAYPEGLAFAVLLMNACSPLIDHIEFRLKPEREGGE